MREGQGPDNYPVREIGLIVSISRHSAPRSSAVAAENLGTSSAIAAASAEDDWWSDRPRVNAIYMTSPPLRFAVWR